LTEQAWSIKDLLYGMKHQKIIFVLVYLQGPKGKPVACKKQWRVPLYSDWVNAEMQSFDWFTFSTSKCLTTEQKKKMYENAQGKLPNSKSFLNFKSFFNWLQFSALMF